MRNGRAKLRSTRFDSRSSGDSNNVQIMPRSPHLFKARYESSRPNFVRSAVQLLSTTSALNGTDGGQFSTSPRHSPLAYKDPPPVRVFFLPFLQLPASSSLQKHTTRTIKAASFPSSRRRHHHHQPHSNSHYPHYFFHHQYVWEKLCASERIRALRSLLLGHDSPPWKHGYLQDGMPCKISCCSLVPIIQRHLLTLPAALRRRRARCR